MLETIITVSRLSPLFAAAINIAMGIYTYSRGRKSLKNIYFFISSIIVGGWAFSCFMQSINITESWAIFWDKILYSFAIFAPLFFLKLAGKFTDQNHETLMKLCWGVNFFLLIVNWTPYFRNGVSFNFGARYVTDPDIGWYIFLLFFTWVVYVILKDLLLALTQKEDEAKTTILLLFISIAILVVGGGSYFLLILIKFSPLIDSLLNLNSSFLTGLYSFLLVYLIVKEEILDLRTYISKIVAQILLISFGVGTTIFLFFVLASYPMLQLISLVSLVILFGVYGQQIRKFIQTPLEKKFLNFDFDIETVINRLLSQLVRASTHSEVLKTISEELLAQLELKTCYYLSREPGTNAFDLLETGTDRVLDQVRFDNAVVDTLAQLQVPLVTHNVGLGIPELERLASKLSCALMFSLGGQDQLQGMILMGSKLTEEKFGQKDFNVIDLIRKQTVYILDRIGLAQLNRDLETQVVSEIEEREKAMETAQQVSYQASLSSLTLGIAHEINNPLAVIKSEMELLDYFPWENRVLVSELETQLDLTSNQATTLHQELIRADILVLSGAFTEHFDPFKTPAQKLPDFSVKVKKEAVHQLLMDRFKYHEVRRAIKVASSMVDRVVDITQTMMAYGKGRSVSRDTVSINTLLSEFETMVTGACKKHAISLEVKPADPDLHCVASQVNLNQVLLNLFSNSRHALRRRDGNKQVRVTASSCVFNGHDGQSLPGIKITVWDNGRGISSDMLKNIFTPFFSSKETARGKNIGLGLSIAYKILNEHDGKIEVSSKEGDYTAFSLYLPQSG